MTEVGRIAIYEPSMAVKCAEMFNAFNEIWPGGFTGGIPYDEQRTREFLDKTSAHADLIALDENDDPVGYCGLYPHWRDKNAAYISILGVHPRVQGKKFGKRLLLKALEVAKEKGLFRVDLYTWPGNMEAVPLYKKIGLFWVPDTSVYMQDFIPGILQNTLAEEWFEKHPNWYGNFKRELKQTQDKETVEGMDVYQYNFEEEDDKLSVHIDRYGWGISSIVRKLDGKEISIKSKLKSHHILMGIENSLCYIIENKTGTDIEFRLSVKPFNGLKWVEDFPDKFIIKKDEILTLERNFIVNRDAKKYKSDQKSSEVIIGSFTFNSYELSISTGAKIHPAVELLSTYEYINTPLGTEKKVYLDLQNHTKEQLKGTIKYSIEGIDELKGTIEYNVKPEEIIGIEIPAKIPEETNQVVFKIQAEPSVKINNAEFLMPEFKIPLVANVPNIAEIVQGPNEDIITLITDFWAIRINLERANVYYTRRYVDDSKIRSIFELGPPYGMDIDRTLRFDYEVIKNGTSTTLKLMGNSRQFEGIRIEKYIRVTPGVKEVEHWIDLINISTTGSIAAGGRLSTSSGGGLNVNPIGNFAKVYTPVYGKYIESEPTYPIMSQTLISQDPKDWHETWTAAEILGESGYSSVIWKPDNVEKIKLQQGFLYNLESKQILLEQNEKVNVAHIWVSFSNGSVRDVRTRWNQLVGQNDLSFDEAVFGVETEPPISVYFKENNIFSKGKTSKATFEIYSITPYPLPGILRLKSPELWETSFITEEGNKDQINMPDIIPNTPLLIEIEMKIPENTTKSSDMIKLCFTGEYELEFEIPILLKKDIEVVVKEDKVEDKGIMIVENGEIKYKVPKNIGGCLIQLEDSEGNTFLADSFPKIGPKFFIEHYLGGLQPAVFHQAEGNPFVELERTETEEFSSGDWKGVRTFWTIEKAERLKGQKYSISYLTLPGSNIIRIILENNNDTSREVHSISGMLADIALKGDPDGNIIHVPGGTGDIIRNRVKKPFLNQTNVDDPWIRVSKEDVSLTFLSPDGYYGSNTIFDGTVMIVNIILSFLETKPFQKSKLESILIVNQPEEAIEEVRKALKK